MSRDAGRRRKGPGAPARALLKAGFDCNLFPDFTEADRLRQAVPRGINPNYAVLS